MFISIEVRFVDISGQMLDLATKKIKDVSAMKLWPEGDFHMC